jgi:hypothetical protein
LLLAFEFCLCHLHQEKPIEIRYRLTDEYDLFVGIVWSVTVLDPLAAGPVSIHWKKLQAPLLPQVQNCFPLLADSLTTVRLAAGISHRHCTSVATGSAVTCRFGGGAVCLFRADGPVCPVEEDGCDLCARIRCDGSLNPKKAL